MAKLAKISGYTVYACILEADSMMMYMSITEDQLVKQIKFLVENIYIQVGNKSFRQTIGIPMGTDCAPLLANLFSFLLRVQIHERKIKTK